MISIIVPVYNVEEYVKRCVESILSQTYRDFELILVDDGSTDRSGEICENLKKEDGRILVFHQENSGLSAARNRGLSEAKGEYITYIDSDDYVDEAYLEVLYSLASKEQAMVAVCGYQLVVENQEVEKYGEKCDEPHLLSGREAVKEIVAGNKRSMITAWGKLYHNSLRNLLVYPEGRLHEDEFVTYKVLYQAEQVVETPAPLYYYFQREKSIMNQGYNLRRLDKLIALHEAISFFGSNRDSELRRFALKRYLLNLQIAWYRIKKNCPQEKEALKKIRQEWSGFYRQNVREIKKVSLFVDKVAIGVFRVSPAAYCMVAGVVNQFFPEL